MPPLSADLWAFGVLLAMLVASAVTDVRSGRIYNSITYPAVLIGLVGNTLLGGLSGNEHAIGLAGSAIGLAVGFLPMLIAWRAGGIGGGDAKLLAAVGALTGWEFTLRAMFLGFAAAAIMGIVVLVRRKILRATLRRIVRFLYLAATPHKPASPATETSPKIPFGLAMCLGSVVAITLYYFQGRHDLRWPLGL